MKRLASVTDEPDELRRAFKRIKDECGVNLFHADRAIVWNAIAHELAEQQRAEWTAIRSLITQIHPDDIAGLIDLIDPEATE